MASSKKNWIRPLSDALNMGTTIVASVVLGFLGGKWLDDKFGTYPWVTLVGFLLGFGTSIKVIWDKAVGTKNSNESNDNNKAN